MKKAIAIALLLSLLPCVLLSGCAGTEERAWQTGQKALAEEDYRAAAAAFEKAGDFQDAGRLRQYAEAVLALENDAYSDAVAGFRALGDFKDSLLMDSYCQAREQEALAQTAFAADDADGAARAALEAYALYSALPLFRDSDTRAAACRDQLYAKSTEWLNLARYEAAAAGFEALGDWQDSAGLQKYCRAALLETQASYLEAAERFSEIPEVLDSRTRAENAREQAYRLASRKMENGDYEAAAEAFAELGGYRDAEAQRDSAVVSQIRTRLRSGSYAEALEKLNSLSDLSAFPMKDPSAESSMAAFLESFLNVWLNAHAHVMTSFFGCSLLQPYLEPGGELDTLVHEELAADDETPLNYGYIYLGSELLALYETDENFTAAKVRASYSVTGPDGYVEAKEDFWVLLDTRGGNPIAAAVLPAGADGR